jgi:hypothetical protein
MPIALQGRQQNRQQRPQALPAYPIGGLPKHDQRRPHRFVIQGGPNPDPRPLGDRLGVQHSNRRLVVIAGHGNELIEDPALLGAACSALAPTDCVGHFSPRRVRHLGAHSLSNLVEAASWHAPSPVTSQVRQLPRSVTFLLTQCGGPARAREAGRAEGKDINSEPAKVGWMRCSRPGALIRSPLVSRVS